MLRKLFPITMAELETRQAKKGLSWILEILVFFAVFIAASTIQGLVLSIAVLVYLLCNPSIMTTLFEMAMRFQGSSQQIMDYMLGLVSKIFLPTLLVTAFVIMAVLFFCTQFQNRKLPSLGFRGKNAVLEYLVGLVLGGAMFSLAVLLSGKTISFAPANGSVWMMIFFFLAYMLQGMSEEILMRGYFMLSFARRNSLLAAILVNSAIFGLLHIGNFGFSLLALCNIFLFGIFASVWFLKRGSIWGVAAIHTAWNFVQGCVWGIPVSGMPAANSVLTATLADGAKLWNGGSFGLEGGLAVTIVLVIFCALAIVMPAKRSALAPVD